MKRFLLTICLCFLLIASFITVIALYISGPNIKYETEIQKDTDMILQQGEGKYLNVKRDVFRYVIYIAETENSYDWYDKDGKLIFHKLKDDIHMDEAISKAMEEHQINDLQGTIGYGFENGAYVLENDTYKILLDIDTMQEIYYQRK